MWIVLFGGLVWALPKAIPVLRAKLRGDQSLAHRGIRGSTPQRRLRVDAAGRPLVEVGRVQPRRLPDWVDRDLFRVVMLELEPLLRGEVAAGSDEHAARLRDHVGSSPWLRDASVERGEGATYRLAYDLRRPELFLAETEDQFLYVADDGTVLPAPKIDLGLPSVMLESRGGHVLYSVDESGRIDDPRVLAAIHVAQEWRDEIQPRLPEPIQLFSVDARNVGWRFVRDAAYSQVLVALGSEGSDPSESAWFQCGLAAVDGSVLDGQARAAILADMLQEYPGLRGIARGDFRLKNTWRQRLQLRSDD